jgi:hypothetical protein
MIVATRSKSDEASLHHELTAEPMQFARIDHVPAAEKSAGDVDGQDG